MIYVLLSLYDRAVVHMVGIGIFGIHERHGYFSSPRLSSYL